MNANDYINFDGGGDEQWESARDKTYDVLMASGLSQTSKISAGLRGLLDALADSTTMSREETKAQIARCLGAFR
ncbi:hypothetical protein [Bradyrhizobium sp. McL0616]|uniref:hypothetical protein n=1 Tax=Bradyrhizobium sp. McL0616 TaxID=3415674 RepID=UPI003CE86C7D